MSRIAVWVILTLGVVWLSKVSGPLTVQPINGGASAWFTIFPVRTAQLNLTWQDNSTNENGFQIERKIGPNGTYVQIASVAANTTSYLDTNLANGTTYCYRVRAFNAFQTSGYTNDACMTTIQ